MLTSAQGMLAAPPALAAPPDRFVKREIALDLASAAKSVALSPQSRGPPGTLTT